jgi:hypothetical protein
MMGRHKKAVHILFGWRSSANNAYLDTRLETVAPWPSMTPSRDWIH